MRSRPLPVMASECGVVEGVLSGRERWSAQSESGRIESPIFVFKPTAGCESSLEQISFGFTSDIPLTRIRSAHTALSLVGRGIG
jgi:hypothetical protein